MLWVYGHYEYFYFYSAGIDFSRQNLTSTDVRFWRLKSIPALKGLITQMSNYANTQLICDSVYITDPII